MHAPLAQEPRVRQVLLYDTEKGIFLSRDFERTSPHSTRSSVLIKRGETIVLGATRISIWDGISSRGEDKITIDHDCLVRWGALFDWIQSPACLLSLHGTLSSNSWGLEHHLSRRLPYVEPLARRILNWQFLDPRMSWYGVLSVGVFVFVTLAYSGIRASAWNGEFPLAIEHLLWKVSCIYLPCYGILAMVIITAIQSVETVYTNRGHDIFSRSSRKHLLVFRLRDIGRAFSPYSGVFEPFLFGPGAFFLGVLTLGFVGARVYFVVESFLALRSKPQAAYDTPNWITCLIFSYDPI